MVNYWKKIFDKIWVQPAAGDAGGSLGAALALWHNEFDNPRINSVVTICKVLI